MLSTDIREINTWLPWPVSWAVLPRCPGVYVIRLAPDRTVGRVQGESDILYIGFSERRVSQRLMQHSDRRTITGAALQRVRDEVGAIEAGWFICPSETEAAISEHDWISLYRRDHVELPPMNCQQPLRRLQRHIPLLGLIPDDRPEKPPALVALVKRKSQKRKSRKG